MQKLNFEQIKKLVHGVAQAEEGDGKISFFRFNKEQRELYKTVSTDFYLKALSTSCITLEFETNSENLLLDVVINPATSRSFFTHSIFVNGEKYDEVMKEWGRSGYNSRYLDKLAGGVPPI